MNGFIYWTLMIGFIGSIFLGLAGCASDGYYEDYDGHHKLWKERAFSRHSGSGSGFTSDEILSGGINQ